MKILKPLVIGEIILFVIGAINMIVGVWNTEWFMSDIFWKFNITLGILILLIGISIGILLFMQEETSEKKNNLIR